MIVCCSEMTGTRVCKQLVRNGHPALGTINAGFPGKIVIITMSNTAVVFKTGSI